MSGDIQGKPLVSCQPGCAPPKPGEPPGAPTPESCSARSEGVSLRPGPSVCGRPPWKDRSPAGAGIPGGGGWQRGGRRRNCRLLRCKRWMRSRSSQWRARSAGPPVRQTETAADAGSVGLAEPPRGFAARCLGPPPPPRARPRDHGEACSISCPEDGTICPQQQREGLPFGVDVLPSLAVADRLQFAVWPLSSVFGAPVRFPADGRSRDPLNAALADVQQLCHLPRREDRPEQFERVGVKDQGLSDYPSGRPGCDPWAHAASHRPQPERPPKARPTPLYPQASRRFHAHPRKREPHPSQNMPSQRRPTAF